MEIYKDLTSPASKEFEQLLNTQLSKTKESIQINTTNLTKRSCFLKKKKIMDKKIIA